MIYSKGKRKYLFCADSKGADSLYGLVRHAMEERVPFDFHFIEDESDSFLDLWFSRQKMGSYLYLSGKMEFVNRVKYLALKAGFTDYEMQTHICGHVKKNLICCQCHSVNETDKELHVTCKHCGVELEVSNHYSRRLDAYLGYVTIK